MALLDPSQIKKFIDGYLRIDGFTALGVDDVVTTEITTRLNTAGDGGVPVPLQVAGVAAMGLLVSPPYNRVEIYSSATKQKIAFSGAEVYGRLTQAAGVYTLGYFSASPTTGADVAYSFASGTAIDFEFVYRFNFEMVPPDHAIGISTRNVNNEANGAGRTWTERLTIATINTVPNLSFTPDKDQNVTLFVNGKAESTQDLGAPITVAGKVVTWNNGSSAAGYNLKVGASVVAKYTTLE